jgi:hypothetical protein
MAMMYTRRLPVHCDVERLLGNFYTVVPLEVDFGEGRTFDALLRDLREQTMEIHRHRWASGIDVMQQLSTIFKRAGRAVVPFVISSAIGGFSSNTAIRSSAFSSDIVGRPVRSVYSPPQVLADVIISKGFEGLLVQYHRNSLTFPSGMQEGVLTSLLELTAHLSADANAWTSRRPATVARDHAKLIERMNSCAGTQHHRNPIPAGLMCDPLTERSRDWSERMAVLTPSVRLTFGELHAPREAWRTSSVRSSRIARRTAASA